MQKFEDECSMEFECINKAYNQLQKPRNESYIKAWQEGNTGIPIIDACMRCLVATGYINFRMRAMLVSFLYLTCGRIGVNYIFLLDSFWIMNPVFIIHKFRCRQV